MRTKSAEPILIRVRVLKTCSLFGGFKWLFSRCSECTSAKRTYFRPKVWLNMCRYRMWSTSRENLFMPYANNKGADQPAHLRSLISAFVVCFLDSIIPLFSISKISSLKPSFCGCAGRFESALVANPENKFYRNQDQDQDSLLVKRRNDNHSPGPVIRELVPSSHQRSELSNTILCIFSGWDQRIGEGIPVPDSLGEETTFINICIGYGSLKCHRVLISKTLSFGDKIIYWYTGFTFKTFI